MGSHAPPDIYKGLLARLRIRKALHVKNPHREAAE
jgi:hypothetical protein